MTDVLADFDAALAMAADQLSTEVRALEEGRPSWDSLCVLHGGEVIREDLVPRPPDRTLAIVDEMLGTRHPNARVASIAMRTVGTDEHGVASDVFFVRVLKPKTPYELSLFLRYERSERVLTLGPDLLLSAALLPPAYCGERLHSGVAKALSACGGLTRARLPTTLAIDFGRRFWPPPGEERSRDVVEQVNAIGEAPLVIFAFVAGADGAVPDQAHEAFGPIWSRVRTEALGKLTNAVLGAGGPEVFQHLLQRDGMTNLLLLGSAGRRLDVEDKRALVEFGERLAAALPSVSERKHAVITDIAAALGLTGTEDAAHADQGDDDLAALHAASSVAEPRTRPALRVGPLRRLFASLSPHMRIFVEADDGAGLLDARPFPGALARDVRGERFVTGVGEGSGPALLLSRFDPFGGEGNLPLTVAAFLEAISLVPDDGRVFVDSTAEDVALAYANVRPNDDSDDDDEDDEDDETELAVNAACLLLPVIVAPQDGAAGGGHRIARGEATSAVAGLLFCRRVPDDWQQLEQQAAEMTD